MHTSLRGIVEGVFWNEKTKITMRNEMQSVLLSLFTATILVVQGVRADCPDYSQFSQEFHAPFSVGRYNLSYMRPDPACRTFNSSVVEDTIVKMQSVIQDPDLYRLFQNAFPNTLDTAVKWKGFAANNSAEELTFLITGDINASIPLPDQRG
jgi:hypothetical protein